jgi:hypothetical protein
MTEGLKTLSLGDVVLEMVQHGIEQRNKYVEACKADPERYHNNPNELYHYCGMESTDWLLNFGPELDAEKLYGDIERERRVRKGMSVEQYSEGDEEHSVASSVASSTSLTRWEARLKHNIHIDSRIPNV